MFKRFDIKDRLIGSGKIATVVGTVLCAALEGAAYQFAQNPNVTDYKPYAMAGAGAAVMAAGALYRKGKQPQTP